MKPNINCILVFVCAAFLLCVLIKMQNMGRRFGQLNKLRHPVAAKAVHSKAVVLLLSVLCLLFLPLYFSVPFHVLL